MHNRYTFPYEIFRKCTWCFVSFLSVIIFLCWTQPHFRPFRSPVQCHQAFGTLSSLLTCNRMKRQKAVTAALRTREISREREGWKERGKERDHRTAACRGVGDVFYVTAVPYCPQKMSLCPWEAALRGETHLSDRIYRDVLWPDPEEPGRRPTALCLPTNTPHTDCFPQNLQWTWSFSHTIVFLLESYNAL